MVATLERTDILRIFSLLEHKYIILNILHCSNIVWQSFYVTSTTPTDVWCGLRVFALCRSIFPPTQLQVVGNIQESFSKMLYLNLLMNLRINFKCFYSVDWGLKEVHSFTKNVTGSQPRQVPSTGLFPVLLQS